MVDRPGAAARCYRFGPFRLDVCSEQLYKGEQPVELPRRLVRTLQLLVENHGKDLAKGYLMEQLWPNAVVEENNLTVIISMLRKALGDDQEQKRYILTRQGRGYRFIAEVVELQAGAPEAHVIPSRASVLSAASGPVLETAAAAEVLVQRVQRPAKRWVLLAGSVVLGLALAISGIQLWRARSQIQAIAVLPFQSGDDEDSYIGLGMADGLIARLRNLRNVVVRPVGSVVGYQNTPHDPRTLGRELHVGSVLDGSVQKTKDQIWVQVRLVRTSDGATLWSDEYHGQFAELLTLQDEIAAQATRALSLRFSSPRETRSKHSYTNNSEAFQHYISGRYYCSRLDRNELFLHQGISFFEQAIAQDPQFALPYAAEAACYLEILFGSDHLSGAQVYPKVEAAAKHAIQIDPSVPEAYLPLALAEAYGDWDFPAADVAFRKSIELAPETLETRVEYAQFLTTQGRFREAEREARDAMDLDPFSWKAHVAKGDVYFYAQRYTEAEKAWQKAQEIDLAEAVWRLGWIDVAEGRAIPITADLALREAQVLPKGHYMPQLAYVYALQGQRPVAASWLQNFLQHPELLDVYDYELSLIYAALGDRDHAFQFLTRARDRRVDQVLYAKVDPRLTSLRSDPRFGELLTSMHLQ